MSSGFDNYLANQTGMTVDGAPSTPATGSSLPASPGSSFPSNYTGTQALTYPSLSKSELALSVPGGEQNQPGVSVNNLIRISGQKTVATGSTIQSLMDILLGRAQTNPDAIAQIQDNLILGGYLDPRSRSYTPGGVLQPGDATWDAYAHLLLDSVRLNTPWEDLLNTRVAAGDGAKKFNLTTTSAQTNLTDPQTARMTLASVMADQLGRKPTNAEIAQYAGTLAQTEAQNPTVSTTTHDISETLNSNGGGPRQSGTTTVSGGSDPQAVAENQIYSQNGPEVAQTRATQTYDLFLRMLQGEGSLA